MNIPILHQDDFFIVVSKPGGLLVHRTAESTDTVFLLQTLSEQVGKYLYPVHRLDRAASGAIAFAFSSEDARLLQQSLQRSDTQKEYLAFVRGTSPAAWTMERALTSDKGIKQDAHTDFVTITSFFRSSLVKASIFTGRRHQIRRHLAHSMHQIIGDTTYGKGKINTFFRENYQLPRLCLHAKRLKFYHPHNKEQLDINAPLVADFKEFLLRLPECNKDIVNLL